MIERIQARRRRSEFFLWTPWTGCVLCILCILRVTVGAQVQMPDVRQMSGIPRPVTDLPDHAISVRLIRGALSNNITDFPVELHVGSKVLTARTDDAGRAQFDNVAPGSMVTAVAVVDGERLESQEFPAPAQGGVRLMLVATDKSKTPEVAGLVPAAPVAGLVSIGGSSRIIIEPGDESVQVYYLFDIVNSARAPVNPPAAFTFDAPSGADGATILEGSSPQASVDGTHVLVQGPFAPGRTLVQVAFVIATPSGSMDLTQRLPASLDQLAVIVKKVGATRLTSPQLVRQQDMTAEGEVFIAAKGETIPAGQPFVLTVDGMPHHSAAPRWIALLLAVAIVAIGAWAATRPADQAARTAERKRLISRRERLFGDLVRLETDQRAGRGNPSRYPDRREALLAALEQIYGMLDTEDETSPDPAGRAGAAA